MDRVRIALWAVPFAFQARFEEPRPSRSLVATLPFKILNERNRLFATVEGYR